MSNDIAKLHVDERKPAETPRALPAGTSGEKLEHEDDDDEDNPLGSHESSGERTNMPVESTTDAVGETENATTNDEPYANKGELKSTADTPSAGNEEGLNTKDEEEDDEEEDDDGEDDDGEDEFSGGIC